MHLKKFHVLVLSAACLCLLLPWAAHAASYQPLPEALAALASDSDVTVDNATVAAWGGTDNYYWSFTPAAAAPETGFIFYPGGLVDPRSYAPTLKAIAKAGFLAVLIKMPGDLAVSTRAADVIAAFPDIKKWAIGGHSLGGIAAIQYVDEQAKDDVTGLALWASYGYESNDISGLRTKTVVVSGSNDALSTPAEIEAGKQYLPRSADYIAIDGANHTQFGYYDTSAEPNGVQAGDSVATITREAQQQQIVAATLDLLNKLSGNCPVLLLLNQEDPGVAALRNFRDTVLARTGLGRKIIALYYENGEAVTAALQRSPALKQYSRAALRALVGLLP